MDRALKQSIFTKYFFISQNVLHAMQKKHYSEDNKKRMNMANFINIYTHLYTYIICDKNDSK